MITIVKTNNGYITYNYRNNPKFNSIDEIEKEFGDGFITGYQITNRK